MKIRKILGGSVFFVMVVTFIYLITRISNDYDNDKIYIYYFFLSVVLVYILFYAYLLYCVKKRNLYLDILIFILGAFFIAFVIYLIFLIFY